MKAAYHLLIAAILLSISCSGPTERTYDVSFRYDNETEVKELLKNPPDYPDAKFIVFSDPHLYLPSLGTNGAAFEKYIEHDSKLLAQSFAVLSNAVNEMSEIDAEFVLVPGDLTKDGSLICHQAFAKQLERLTNSGKKVFVVPGNHDIASAAAKRFDGDKTEKIKTISKGEFLEIYSNYGYSQAIYKDENSLSYVAEPVDGLWLLAVDSARYPENDPVNDHHPITGAKLYHEEFRKAIPEDAEAREGRVYSNELRWIESMLVKAAEEGKAVILLLHHGVVEHWPGQNKLHWEYLLPGYEKLSEFFANYNVRLAFTGHYHSQDTAKAKFDNGKYIFDVETGSFVTFPNPYRTVEITNNIAEVLSFYIKELEGYSSFREFAFKFTWDGVYKQSYDKLIDGGLSEDDAENLAGQGADAFLAHYLGNEVNRRGYGNELDTEGLGFIGKIAAKDDRFGYIIKGLWRDTEGSDDDLTIYFSNGDWGGFGLK